MPDTSVNLATCKNQLKIEVMKYVALALIAVISFILGYVSRDQRWFKETRHYMYAPPTDGDVEAVIKMLNATFESDMEIQHIAFNKGLLYIYYYD